MPSFLDLQLSREATELSFFPAFFKYVITKPEGA